MSKKKKAAAAPDDDLYLTKKEILEILDLIIDHWQKNKLANWVYIQTIRGIKLAVMVMDEGLLRVLWKQLIFVFNHIYKMSEMERLSGDMPRARFFIDRLKDDLRSGRVFDYPG